MTTQLLTWEQARLGAITLQKRFTQSTHRRECPPIFVIFHFVKAPSKSSGPHRIPLPHPVRPFPFLNGTLFVGGEASKWEPLIQKTGLSLKVISLSMLRKHYNTRKERDSLLHDPDSGQLFCEESIASQLPNRLGSQFFSRNRQPIRIKIQDTFTPDELKEEFRQACECSELYIRKDTTCLMRIGAFNLSFDYLGENIASAVQQAYELIPKAKARIESITLMTSGLEIQPIWEKNPKKITLTAEDIKGPQKSQTLEEEENEE